MNRTDNHVTETESRQIFESAVTRFTNVAVQKGDLLFRKIDERDYGIDGQVELFNHGVPTGRFAMIQLKGTEKSIVKLKTDNTVSCSGISKSNLSYCRQNNVPVILVYCSTADGKFYYIDLQSVYKDKIPEIGDKGSGTVRIPIANNSDDLGKFVDIINSYYEQGEITGIRGERQNIESESDPFVKISTYEFVLHQTPTDGEHREVDMRGETIREGYWVDGELIKGTEYNWLIHVVSGELIYKSECLEDPYDASEDFQYEKMEAYGWEELFPFSWSESEIENDGFGKFYVVDMEVDEKTEQMTNIRTLVEFLSEKNPKRMLQLKMLMPDDNQSEV